MLTKLQPESFDIANAFLIYGTIKDTAEQLQLPQEEVSRILNTKEVKSYLDNIYLDLGYRNRQKLANVLDKMIDSKVEEALETGMWTAKDLLELLQFAHKMRMDEIKAMKDTGVTTAVQVNNNFDGSYSELLKKLL